MGYTEKEGGAALRKQRGAAVNTPLTSDNAPKLTKNGTYFLRHIATQCESSMGSHRHGVYKRKRICNADNARSIIAEARVAPR